MALFKASDILDDKVKEHELIIHGFKDEHTEESIPLTLIVRSSRSLVKKVWAIKDEAVTDDIWQIQKGKHRGQTKIDVNVNHDIFVRKVLDLVYVSSSGDVVDEHSKEVIIALAEQFPGFQEKLSNKLYAFYKTGKTFYEREEDDDKKNSLAS